jgi:hypothetical protein
MNPIQISNKPPEDKWKAWSKLLFQHPQKKNNNPGDTWISDFQSPGLSNNKFLWFNPLRLWHFITFVLANKRSPKLAELKMKECWVQNLIVGGCKQTSLDIYPGNVSHLSITFLMWLLVIHMSKSILRIRKLSKLVKPLFISTNAHIFPFISWC